MTIKATFHQSAALSTLGILGQDYKIHRMRWQDIEAMPSLGEQYLKKEYLAPFGNIDGLKARLDSPDHAVFYFIEPPGSGLPLITLQARLVKRPLLTLQEIMQPVDKTNEESDTAIFFSIINWGSGGRLGRNLIMKATDYIQATKPTITNYITFSPMPNFRTWLNAQTEDILRVDQLRDGLQNSFSFVKETLMNIKSVGDFEALTRDLSLCRDQMRLGANYLLTWAPGKDGKLVPNDDVAKFHPRNGAQLSDLHFGGNVSALGIEQSMGLAARYIYSGQDLTKNQSLFEAGTIARSDVMQNIFNGLVSDRAITALTHRL